MNGLSGESESVLLAWDDPPVSWPPIEGEVIANASDACGVRDKLAMYCLDVHHQVGGPKAQLFRLVLGITLEDDLDYLAAAILEGVRRHSITLVRPNPPWGFNCNVVIPIAGVRDREGRTANVLTSWQLRHEGDRPRLVTAYLD